MSVGDDGAEGTLRRRLSIFGVVLAIAGLLLTASAFPILANDAPASGAFTLGPIVEDRLFDSAEVGSMPDGDLDGIEDLDGLEFLLYAHDGDLSAVGVGGDTPIGTASTGLGILSVAEATAIVGPDGTLGIDPAEAMDPDEPIGDAETGEALADIDLTEETPSSLESTLALGGIGGVIGEMTTPVGAFSINESNGSSLDFLEDDGTVDVEEFEAAVDAGTIESSAPTEELLDESFDEGIDTGTGEIDDSIDDDEPIRTDDVQHDDIGSTDDSIGDDTIEQTDEPTGDDTLGDDEAIDTPDSDDESGLASALDDVIPGISTPPTHWMLVVAVTLLIGLIALFVDEPRAAIHSLYQRILEAYVSGVDLIVSIPALLDGREELRRLTLEWIGRWRTRLNRFRRWLRSLFASNHDTAEPVTTRDSSNEPDARHRIRSAFDAVVSVSTCHNVRTATPTMVANGAIEAGAPADAVRTITRAFREVEYGDLDPGQRLNTVRTARGRLDTWVDPSPEERYGSEVNSR